MDDLDLGQTIRGLATGEKVFERYTIGRKLGEGAMGVVWLAHDEELCVDVALKFLPELVAVDRGALEDLKRETRRSRELAHKNIVKVYHFESKGERAAIAMEFVEGRSLADERDSREQRCLLPNEILPWIEQIADALDYAHTEAKMVHRDLKPKNIMLTPTGRIKIADFGIASTIVESVSQVSMRHPTSGTPPYMSPQQMDGRLSMPSDDIYSLGATIYDLLTGKPPFYRGNASTIAHQIQNITPPTMNERRAELAVVGEAIPEQWERTIAACLEKDPAKRPQSAREVMAMLQAPLPPKLPPPPVEIFTPQPAVPPPPIPPQPVGEPPNFVSPVVPPVTTAPIRVRFLILAGAVAVTLLLLVVLFALRRERKTVSTTTTPAATQQASTPLPVTDNKSPATRSDKTASLTAAEKDYEESDNYRFGLGKVPIDNGRALGLMERAAAQHLPEAEARLARWLRYGALGVEKDKTRAEELARQALADGLVTRAQQNANAQVALAYLCQEGIGVNQDTKQAVELYQKAADQGSAVGQTELAILYQLGTGVNKDLWAAANLYGKAAAQNHALAQRNLALLYKNGTGVQKNLSKAVELLQQASDQGYAMAQNSFAIFYEEGIGVTKDYTRAVSLYEKAASQGLSDAQYNLGVLYEKGQGVTKDMSKALALYQKAADQGDPDAQSKLGFSYETGLGVPKDINKAVEFYQKAAAQDNVAA
ncbi:MAG TPA: protein kinase, partial [Chthoniobacterales bacterium]